jgi:hypothetical protein
MCWHISNIIPCDFILIKMYSTFDFNGLYLTYVLLICCNWQWDQLPCKTCDTCRSVFKSEESQMECVELSVSGTTPQVEMGRSGTNHSKWMIHSRELWTINSLKKKESFTSERFAAQFHCSRRERWSTQLPSFPRESGTNTKNEGMMFVCNVER